MHRTEKKMATVEKDTIPLFSGMAVGVDVIGPVQLMVSDYGQYEASLRINLKDKYYPVFELGYGKADASDESTEDHLQDKCSLCPHRYRLEPAEEQARRLPSVWWFPLRFHLLSNTTSLLLPSQDPVWGGDLSLRSRRRILQLSLAGRSLRSRCQDMGTHPYGMELQIQAPVGPEGWRNGQHATMCQASVSKEVPDLAVPSTLHLRYNPRYKKSQIQTIQ